MKTKKPANKQFNRSEREEAMKFEMEALEKEKLDLKGKKREEAMKAYRRLLHSSVYPLVYFMRS